MMLGSEAAACMAMGVETVVERDAAGERVVDALLRLDRDDRALAGQHRI